MVGVDADEYVEIAGPAGTDFLAGKLNYTMAIMMNCMEVKNLSEY